MSHKPPEWFLIELTDRLLQPDSPSQLFWVVTLVSWGPYSRHHRAAMQLCRALDRVAEEISRA